MVVDHDVCSLWMASWLYTNVCYMYHWDIAGMCSGSIYPVIYNNYSCLFICVYLTGQYVNLTLLYIPVLQLISIASLQLWSCLTASISNNPGRA